MSNVDFSLVNPLVSAGSDEPIAGFISSRLMAAYKLDDEHVIHVATDHGDDEGRVFWHYVLEHAGDVIFEGEDFSTPWRVTYAEAARGILGFLTLQDGDTDDEYFDGYSPEQLAWRDEHAEYLALFGMDQDD